MPIRIKLQKLLLLILIPVLVASLIACGNKRAPTPFVAESKKNWLLSYNVFYRNDLLILQARIIDSLVKKFEFSKMQINYIQDGNNLQQYKNQSIYKKQVANEIEIALFPFVEQRFFQLVYSDKEKFFSNWLKPVLSSAIPTPQFTNVYVDYDLRNKLLLTLNFQNLQNYHFNLYGKEKIFPLVSFSEDLAEHPLELDVTGLLVRFFDNYGNESKAVDISNWF